MPSFTQILLGTSVIQSIYFMYAFLIYLLYLQSARTSLNHVTAPGKLMMHTALSNCIFQMLNIDLEEKL
jgi:hypothetical protein